MMPLIEPIPAISRVGLPHRPPPPTIHSVREELDRERREHGILQQAVFEAAQIQRRLCAPRELDCQGYEIAGEIFPVRHLSGDFFKVIELDGLLGIAVGDIAGKGLTAGIWLAHLLNLVQRCARSSADPARVVAEINRELCRQQDEPPLTALFFAILDPHTHQLTFTNAGLPAPLLLRANHAIDRLDAGGPMLGAMEAGSFEAATVTLHPGDMLVAYSDGVTECRNPEDQEFEVDRLAAAASAAFGSSANPALFSMLGSVLDFADSSTPGDDLTLLVLRRQSGSALPPAADAKGSFAPHRKAASLIRPKKAAPRGRCSK